MNLKLIYIIKGYVADLFKTSHRNKHLPKTIDDYHLVKPLNTSSNRPFLTGIYESKRKKQVFAKIWLGSQKDVHYYELAHEFLVSKILADTSQRLRSLPKQFKNIGILPFIKLIEEKEFAAIIEEYVIGNKLKWTIDSDKGTYKLVKTYLRYIGKKITKEHERKIGKINISNILLKYPFIFIAAMIKRPKYSKILLNTIPTFFNGLIPLSKENPNIFTHGDLHPKNIIKNKGRIYITDFEQSRFSYEFMEDITTILHKNNNLAFITALFSKIQREWENNQEKWEAFQTLSIFIATYNLTANLSEGSINRCINLFNRIGH